MWYRQSHSDKEVSDGAFYRTEADTPDRNAADAVCAGRRTGLCRGVVGGAGRDGVAGGGREVAGLRIHTAADALGLSRSGDQPGRLVPGGGGAGLGLAGVAGRAAVYAGDRSVLQGAAAAAGVVVRAAGAGDGGGVAPGGVGGLG